MKILAVKMNRCFHPLLPALIAASLLCVLLGLAVQAAPASDPSPGDGVRPPLPVDCTLWNADQEAECTLRRSNELPDSASAMPQVRVEGGSIAVLIELGDEPAARIYAGQRQRASAAQATARAQDQIRRISATQDALLAAAPLADARVIFRTQRVHNGVAVLVAADLIAAIEALPGVRAVHPLPVYEVALSRTVPFLGAPHVWEHLYTDGPAGDSVSIGIVDTGIDYLHTHFGGPGTGYDANDPTVITDNLYFPSAKVVGGFDFAGDRYNAGPGGNAVPVPDPDPMDCWGHGTHVAGIAAGYGVLQGGRTYTGTYDSSLAFGQFAIGPGVAPRADLYALKIFGCSGVSQLLNVAVEWAVDPNGDGDFSDHLDVLNLSLGSAYGLAGDPGTLAVENAALAGVIVVAAAGNNGDTYYIAATPGVAGPAISVASSSVAGLPSPDLATTQARSVVDGMSGFSSRGPRRGDAALKPDITAPGSNIQSAAAQQGNGSITSSGTSMATPHVAGAAALLRQLHPTWTVEEIKALLLNTARHDLLADPAYPPVRYGAGRSGAGRLDLSAVQRAGVVAYNADDRGLVSLSYGAPAVLGQVHALKTVRLINKGALTRTLFITYTPVVDLPGVGFEVTGGLLRQLAPFGTANVPVLLSADAGVLRALRDPTVAPHNYLPRHWLSEETGFLTFWPERTPFSATLAGGGSALFSLEPASGRLAYTLTLRATGALTVAAADLHYGSSYDRGPVLQSLITQTLSGAEGITATGQLTLTGDEMQWLSTERAYLQVTTGDDEMRAQLVAQESILRLPVYVAPQPVAAMRSDIQVLDYGAAVSDTRTLSLVGQGLLSAGRVESSRFPTDTVSLVTALELQFSSPNQNSSKGALNHADLRYVGVATDAPAMPSPLDRAGPVAGRRIIFGIVTYGEWSTPGEVTFRVHLDTDEDGDVEYELRTTSIGSFLGSGATDDFVTVLADLDKDEEKLTYFLNVISSAEMNTALFNNNVLLMAVDAADLGLSAQNSDFNYIVSTRSRDAQQSEGLVDFTRLLRYDVAQPGLAAAGGRLGDLPIFYDLPGEQMAVTYVRQAFQANRSQGLLLVHHHNEPGQRAEVIRVRHQWPLYLPWISSDGD